jgi:hypothetical protein
MRRKLIKQGLGGVTLSLPIKWIRNNNLTPGDEISLEEEENKLILSNVGKKGIKKKEFNIEITDKKHLRSIISSTYKTGCTEIILKSNKKVPLKQINEIISSFTGLELVDQSEKSVTIKSFILTDEQGIEKLMIKMFQITQSIASSFVDKNSDLEYTKNLALINMRKLRDHCLRTININRYGGDKTYDYYDLVTVLEKLSSEFYDLNKTVEKNKQNTAFSNILINLEKTYLAFLKKDLTYSNTVWLNVEKEKNRIKELTPSLINMYNYRIIQLLRHLSSRVVSLST